MEPITSGTVLTFGGIILLLQVFNLVVNIYAKLRRNPPIDQTLRDYVRRDEFDRLRVELEKRCEELRKTDGKLFDQLREMTERNATWQGHISTQLGRLETSVEDLKNRIRP